MQYDDGDTATRNEWSEIEERKSDKNCKIYKTYEDNRDILLHKLFSQ